MKGGRGEVGDEVVVELPSCAMITVTDESTLSCQCRSIQSRWSVGRKSVMGGSESPLLFERKRGSWQATRSRSRLVQEFGNEIFERGISYRDLRQCEVPYYMNLPMTKALGWCEVSCWRGEEGTAGSL